MGFPSRVAIGLVYVDPAEGVRRAHVDGGLCRRGVGPVRLALGDRLTSGRPSQDGGLDLSDQSPTPMTDFVKMIHLWSGRSIAAVDPAAKQRHRGEGIAATMDLDELIYRFRPGRPARDHPRASTDVVAARRAAAFFARRAQPGRPSVHGPPDKTGFVSPSSPPMSAGLRSGRS